MMQVKHALCTAALAIPLLVAGLAPVAADVDVGLGVGNSYYYGRPYYYESYYGPAYYGLGDPYYGYDRYDDEVFLGATVDVDDDDADVVVEPSAAAPAPCVKTNVKNFKNACPM